MLAANVAVAVSLTGPVAVANSRLPAAVSASASGAVPGVGNECVAVATGTAWVGWCRTRPPSRSA